MIAKIAEHAGALIRSLPHIKNLREKTVVVKYGGKALGLSGMDGALLEAVRVGFPDLGLVGDIPSVTARARRHFGPRLRSFDGDLLGLRGRLSVRFRRLPQLYGMQFQQV
jgi:hypothetical protein